VHQHDPSSASTTIAMTHRLACFRDDLKVELITVKLDEHKAIVSSSSVRCLLCTVLTENG
jgi:hypothetical protein